MSSVCGKSPQRRGGGIAWFPHTDHLKFSRALLMLSAMMAICSVDNETSPKRIQEKYLDPCNSYTVKLNLSIKGAAKKAVLALSANC